MNKSEYNEELLRAILVENRKFCAHEISSARKALRRRNWYSWLMNVPLFLVGCWDLYDVRPRTILFGRVDMLLFVVFTTINWVSFDTCLKRHRLWKQKWAELTIRGEEILKDMVAKRERGFE